MQPLLSAVTHKPLYSARRVDQPLVIVQEVLPILAVREGATMGRIIGVDEEAAPGGRS